MSASLGLMAKLTRPQWLHQTWSDNGADHGDGDNIALLRFTVRISACERNIMFSFATIIIVTVVLKVDPSRKISQNCQVS